MNASGLGPRWLQIDASAVRGSSSKSMLKSVVCYWKFVPYFRRHTDENAICEISTIKDLRADDIYGAVAT